MPFKPFQAIITNLAFLAFLNNINFVCVIFDKFYPFLTILPNLPIFASLVCLRSDSVVGMRKIVMEQAAAAAAAAAVLPTIYALMLGIYSCQKVFPSMRK